MKSTTVLIALRKIRVHEEVDVNPSDQLRLSETVLNAVSDNLLRHLKYKTQVEVTVQVYPWYLSS